MKGVGIFRDAVPFRGEILIAAGKGNYSIRLFTSHLSGHIVFMRCNIYHEIVLVLGNND